MTCHGCYGSGYGCGGACYGGYVSPTYYEPVWGVSVPAHGAPLIAQPVLTGDPVGAQGEEKKDGVSYESGERAQLILEIPEGADLYIDGQKMSQKSGRRQFHTPPLLPDQAYFYDVRVVVEENGQAKEQHKRIVVRGGHTLTEVFDGLIPAEPRIYVSTD